MSIRRHLFILIALTVLIRGVMFISYPLGGQDEGQGYHRYAVSKVVAGDLQIGNLRHAPGYPLFIAPISAIAELFGRFDERVVLLFQVVLSATIPFLLYDIIRKRHSPRAAFIIALLCTIEPFSLQWAHFSQPVWLVAICLVFALWLLHYADEQRSWQLVVLAGLVTGYGVLVRWNYAPVAAAIGVLLLFARSEELRNRVRRFALFGTSGLLLVLGVHFLVQVPVTGVWDLSCISAANLIETVTGNRLRVAGANGPDSRRFLLLSSFKPLPLNETTMSAHQVLSADAFSFWQTPGPWASLEEREIFLSQGATENSMDFTSGNSLQTEVNRLIYYLGPCEVERLLRGVFFETVLAQPWEWLRILPEKVLLWLQPSLQMGEYPNLTLPSEHSLTYSGDWMLGFQRAFGRWDHYTGQWVWRPGIEIFTSLWAPLNALRFLVFPALVWALFTRRRIYTATAFLLLLYVFVLAFVDAPESRIYAIVYPLGPVLVGGLLVAAWERLRRLTGH